MSVGLSKLGSSSGECGKTVIVKHAGGIPLTKRL